MAQNTAAGVLVNIFTAPQAAFAAIKERPNPWLPLLVIILSNALVQFTYVQAVDLGWFLDSQMANANITEEQRAQAVENALRLPPVAYGFIAAIPTAIGFLIVFSLFALYYTGVSFATNDGIKFGQWLALIAWCSLPSVLGQLASFVNLVANDARFMPPQAVNPISFGALLGIDPVGVNALEATLMNLDVTTLWSVVLLILGYQAFTQRSSARAALVVLAPYVVIVLIVSLFALT